jgi:hypothetical protein
MKVEAKTSNMKDFKPADIARIGVCLQIEIPGRPDVTVRLTTEQWKVLEESARHAQDGM